MAVSIAPGSGNIRLVHAPKVRTPRVRGTDMVFPGRMELEGSVRFTGTDPRAGWDIGWIQVEWVETNWGDYRGQFDRDGSIFLQKGRPPAHRTGAMRDTLVVGDIFTRPTDHMAIPIGPMPMNMAVSLNDEPSDNYSLVERNHLTGKDNYLHEVQLEFMFCSIFTARDPAGTFHHLAHVYWNLRWQYKFFPQHFPPASTTGDWLRVRSNAGTGASISRVFHGAPNDARFNRVITSVQTDNANSVAAAAVEEVQKQNSPNRHTSRRWDSWDVRRP